MQRRMRAAEAAVPFVHPKLSVAANVYSFAAQMEELRLNNDCDCGDRLPRYRCLMTARIDYDVYRGPTELCAWRLCLAPGCRRT